MLSSGTYGRTFFFIRLLRSNLGVICDSEKNTAVPRIFSRFINNVALREMVRIIYFFKYPDETRENKGATVYILYIYEPARGSRQSRVCMCAHTRVNP